MFQNSLAVCISEDRPSEEVAIKLLVSSLAKHCPDIKIYLVFPPANADFEAFTKQFQQVTFRREPFEGAYGWNVKPHALLYALQQGHDEAMWIDSDIILNADFRDRLGVLDESTIVVTEEPHFPWYSQAGKRAKNWGFNVGRSLPFCANSCVLRVTRHHIPMLRAWQEILESNLYRTAQQSTSFADRPIHLRGDQDVLTALLESDRFASIPIKALGNGKDIIQYHDLNDYSVANRLANVVRGLPPLIHSQGIKPWWGKEEVLRRCRKLRSPRHLLRPLFVDLSPYKYVAAHYKYELEDDLTWVDCWSGAGTFFKILGLGNPSLAGLPLTFMQHVFSFSKQLVFRLKAVASK